MRKYLMEGDFFVAASMASTLSKLAMRYTKALQDQAGVVEDPSVLKKVRYFSRCRHSPRENCIVNDIPD
jgi:hypothetical protein